ncbi:MAG: prepilin-type N-terminal cleavage/methylation domain-containing protein [Proteobacteria bacterium]|nr:prepilin-type N-terminal cleavage/methylation domain-containing protein [Pseudomonadota bacterium]
MKEMKERKGFTLSLTGTPMTERKGFTLVELLVALVLSFILVGAIYRSFTFQQKAYSVQDQIAEAQQNVRMAMNVLLRDIRMAGYGMPDGGITIGKDTFTHAIRISPKAAKVPFDSITLVGAFGTPVGYLDRTLAPASTEIYVRSSGEAANFDSTNNKYIFIGGLESLTVLSVDGNKIVLNGQTKVRYPTAILNAAVQSGDTDLPVINASGLVSGDVLSLGTETITITGVSTSTVTVDTDLETAGNQGIIGNYPLGTIINPVPVFRVTAVEYALDPYTMVLTREDKAAVADGGTAAELAGNILDIQVNPNDQNDQSRYTIALIAQTRKPDADYTQNGGYRQRVLRSTVALRNL